MNRNVHAFLYSFLGIIVILVDQVTKQWAVYQLADGPIHITSWLTFQLVFNRGVSWGMFSSPKPAVFWTATAFISTLTLYIAILAYRRFLKNRSIIGEVLVVSGSISNLIDRVTHGAVVDFIDISFKIWSWPVFNLADCCIVLGVILIIINQYRK